MKGLILKGAVVGLLSLPTIAFAQAVDKGTEQRPAALDLIPTGIYDPTAGPALRNPWRPDIASCSQWWGGPVGTILPPGMVPPPAPPEGTHGLVGFNYSSSCHLIEGLASASVRAQGFFVRGTIYGEDVGEWRDGHGTDQRNGFDRRTYSAGVGFAAPDGTLLSFDYTRAERHKTLYGGALLDTRFFDADIFAARARLPVMAGPLKAIEVTAKATLLERENDNFSYRPLVGAATLARFSRDLIEGRAAALFAQPGLAYSLGVDVKDDHRDATRFQGASISTLNAQSRVQPDARVSDVTAFGDVTANLNASARLLAGIRLGFVSAQADDVNASGLVTPGYGATPTPRSLFLQYYGVTGEDRATETNLGGKLRLEQDFLSKTGTAYVSVSRQVRTADPVERYFVSFTPPSGASLNPGPVHRTWIGNPTLDPEKHHIAEAGFAWQHAGWKLAARTFIDHADDFILWDRARGQSGILMSNNASVFRNIDALIAGLSGRVGYRWSSGFFTRIDAHLTYGENLTDNRPIGQIPAIEVITTVGYDTPAWGIEGRLRAVAPQNRVDNYFRTGSGVDGNGLGSEGSGFALVDVMATWRPLPNATLQVGVENLFDKAYTEHIERNDIDDPFLVNQMAAGRSLVLRGLTRF
ncbi:MAG: TonB-dependent receptor [Hyphomicrobiaceae bacterium]|nr:MAG: TonB-dependent receptor [Hyphomicrobiaceae bacterium]